MSDLKNVVTLAIGDSTRVDKKSREKREKAFETMLEQGYCEHCAKQTLRFVGEILRKQS